MLWNLKKMSTITPFGTSGKMQMKCLNSESQGFLFSPPEDQATERGSKFSDCQNLGRSRTSLSQLGLSADTSLTSTFSSLSARLLLLRIAQKTYKAPLNFCPAPHKIIKDSFYNTHFNINHFLNESGFLS